MSAILNQYCYFGPYNDLSAAYAAIPIKYRYGKVFGIVNGTAIDSFWWKDSTNLIDGAEVIRTSGSLILDPDVAIYVANVVSVGGGIFINHKTAINSFVLRLKTHGIWSRIIEMSTFTGNNLLSSGVKLKQYNSTAYLIDLAAGGFVNNDYSSAIGLSSSIDNKYLDTRFLVDQNTPIVKGISAYIGFNSNFRLSQGTFLDPVLSLIAGTGNFQWYEGNLNAIGTNPNGTYSGGLFNQLAPFDITQFPTYNFIHGIRQSANLNSVYRNGTLISSNTIHDEVTGNRTGQLILSNLTGTIKFYALDDGNLTNDQVIQFHQDVQQLMYDLGREVAPPVKINDGLHNTSPVTFSLT